MKSLGDLSKELFFWFVVSTVLVFLCFLLWKLLKSQSFKFPLTKVFSFLLVAGIAGFGLLYPAEKIAKAYEWEALLRFIPPVKKALVVIILTLFALGYVENLLKKFQKHMQQRGISKGKVSAIRKICHYIIYFIALLILFQLGGLGIGPILTFGGIGVAALALASQDILSNFFGGLMIFFRSPFYEGDEIAVPAVSNFKGTVREIGLYATLFENENKQYAYFPNSLFCKTLIVNKSRTAQSLIIGTIKIGVEYRKNLEQFIQNFREIASEHQNLILEESEFTDRELMFKFTLAFDKLEREELIKKKAQLFNQMYDLVSPLQGSVRLMS